MKKVAHLQKMYLQKMYLQKMYEICDFYDLQFFLNLTFVYKL